MKPMEGKKKTSLARVYGTALKQSGIDYATAKLNDLKLDTVHYYLSEQELNWLGYDLLYADFKEHDLLALEVFKINSLLFPLSFNVYDSYGESLWRNGKNKEAILMYKKSIELNPDNEGGKAALKELLKISFN
jgi:tetratricopeptide (TPR) repeat protein